MSPRGRAQFFACLGFAGQQVCDPQLGGDVDGLRHPVACDQPPDPLSWVETTVPWPDTPLTVQPVCDGHVVAEYTAGALKVIVRASR